MPSYPDERDTILNLLYGAAVITVIFALIWAACFLPGPAVAP